MTGKYEYADSAPASLIGLHRKWVEIYEPFAKARLARPGDTWCINTMYRLISKESEPIMKRVWKSLARQTPPPLYDVADLEEWKMYSAGLDLWGAVEDAMMPPPPHWRKSPGEKAEELLAIAKKARELSRLIERSRYLGKTSVYSLFSTEALSALIRRLNADEYIELKFMPRSTSFDEAVRFALPWHPSVERILEALAEYASKNAKQPDVVKRKTRNYEAVYFARVMTDHMVERYGKPLRGVVAAVGGLFFDVMDEEFVRKNAPARKKSG